MATGTMIFGFIRVKTMANFRKRTWKLRGNIRCVVGYVNNVVNLKVMHGLRFNL